MKRTLITYFLSGLAAAISYRDRRLASRAAPASSPSFGYDGLQGPLNWHALSPENSVCARGRFQSPISLTPELEGVDAVGGQSLGFRVDEYDGGASVVNTGTTVEVSASGRIQVDGEVYALTGFHFHTPSEHHIGTEVFAMEVHFVFAVEDDSLAVVGILLDVNTTATPSPFFTAILSQLHTIPNPGDRTLTGPLSPRELELHVGRSEVYQYNGSLTTPPCTEGVHWSVVRDPVFVSAGEFGAAKGILGFNARYTQNAPGEQNLLYQAAEEIVNAEAWGWWW